MHVTCRDTARRKVSERATLTTRGIVSERATLTTRGIVSELKVEIHEIKMVGIALCDNLKNNNF